MKNATRYSLLLLLLFCLGIGEQGIAQKKKLLVPFLKGNLWGYSDTAGKLIITPKFTKAGFFEEDNNMYYANGEINGKAVLITEDGKFIEDKFSDDQSMLFGGLAEMGQQMYFEKDQIDSSLDQGGKHGFVYNEKTDIMRKSPAYGTVLHLYNNNTCALIVLKSTNKIGGVDKTGNIVIPFEYDAFTRTYGKNEAYAKLQKNGHLGLLNLLTRKEIIPFIYDDITVVSDDDNLLVRKGAVSNIVDINHKLLYDSDLYNASYHDHLIVAAVKGNYGYLDGNGKVIIPFMYSKAAEFGKEPAINGFAQVTNKDGIQFFISKKGREYYSK